jgi:hypothetical protein
MSQTSLKQLRGAKDLIHDAVAAGVDASEQVHLAIARKPYAALAQIEVLAGPVQVIEQTQLALTCGIYQAIRIVNRFASAAAGRVLDQLE